MNFAELRIVYFGSPEFAACVLKRLWDGGIHLVGVVTQPPRPKGRSSQLQPTAVAELVRERSPSLPLYEWEEASAPENLIELEKLQADLFIVVAFGQFLRKGLRELPRLDCINLHPSLLPLYRGAAPIQHALIRGDEETGVSIMKVVAKMDAGEVIRQERLPIGPDETLGELEERLCERGAELMLQVVADFAKGEVEYHPQDPDQVTEAPKLGREDGELIWSRPAAELYNLFRGVTPRPGAWCWVTLRGERFRMKVLALSLIKESSSLFPGEQIAPLIVACSSGALQLDSVQLEGRRPVQRAELLRGIEKSDLAF